MVQGRVLDLPLYHLIPKPLQAHNYAAQSAESASACCKTFSSHYRHKKRYGIQDLGHEKAPPGRGQVA
jgi:hypothetical protein